ncbi:platelet glycoprotein VI [Heterocephalus glaber]|uniref:Platelet glycoprotein VI n=1 Tax=Heterocephalus glaber TaxID=10181 RepID=A0AAX6RWP8_HETGA|nr:platelet glycoprotein VI [Heterocephalus glaber]
MKTSHAGRYRCSYQNRSRWSLPSDNLELVATGVYRKPSLSAHPSPAVSPGGDVTLQCRTQYGFDQFALYKEGDAGPHKRPEKWYRADFSLITVTAAHSGTYRCYSFSSAAPFLWSAPSEPLELRVTGASEAPTQSPTQAPSSTTESSRTPSISPMNIGSTIVGARGASLGGGAAPQLEGTVGSGSGILWPARVLVWPPPRRLLPPGFARLHYAKGNLVRLCLGALVLVLLAGFLAEAWHSRKKRLPLRVRAMHRPLPPLPHALRSPGCQHGAPPGAQRQGHHH